MKWSFLRRRNYILCFKNILGRNSWNRSSFPYI